MHSMHTKHSIQAVLNKYIERIQCEFIARQIGSHVSVRKTGCCEMNISSTIAKFCSALTMEMDKMTTDRAILSWT